MATLTKEQIDLINEIRRLQQKVELLDYKQHLQFCKLIDQANDQNLCWW